MSRVGHTSAPVWQNGVPKGMYNRAVAPLDSRFIIEKIDQNTPETGYVYNDEMDKYKARSDSVSRYGRHSNEPKEMKPHWHEEADTYFNVSIVGMRAQNEDSVFALLEKGLFAIFDGWGGKARSHQAALWLGMLQKSKGLFTTNRDKADMLLIFNEMNTLFKGMADPAQKMEYITPHYIPTAVSGCTAIIAAVDVARKTITLGNLGDTEAYVLDVATRTLAVPPTAFEAYDAQTGETISGEGYAAATIPHGFTGHPKFDEKGQFKEFEIHLIPSELETRGPPLCVADGSLREYQTTRQVMGADFSFGYKGHTSRVLGAPDPRRSMGEIGDDWDTEFGHGKPMTAPEVFTWGFNDRKGFKDKWLVLCCDGIYSHYAFRGPNSVCAFLMDPFQFLAYELEKSGNMWMELLERDSSVGREWLTHTVEMRRIAESYHGTVPVDIQRPLLRRFFQHLYQIEAEIPALFYKDNEGSDAVHQATLFFMQWTQFGKIGGLAGPEEDLNAEDLAAALAYLCSMQLSDDNVSVTLVKLENLV